MACSSRNITHTPRVLVLISIQLAGSSLAFCHFPNDIQWVFRGQLAFDCHLAGRHIPQLISRRHPENQKKMREAQKHANTAFHFGIL